MATHATVAYARAAADAEALERGAAITWKVSRGLRLGTPTDGGELYEVRRHGTH